MKGPILLQNKRSFELEPEQEERKKSLSPQNIRDIVDSIVINALDTELGNMSFELETNGLKIDKSANKTRSDEKETNAFVSQTIVSQTLVSRNDETTREIRGNDSKEIKDYLKEFATLYSKANGLSCSNLKAEFIMTIAPMNTAKSMMIVNQSFELSTGNNQKGVPHWVMIPYLACRDGPSLVKSRNGTWVKAMEIKDTTDILEVLRSTDAMCRPKCLLVDEVQFFTTKHIDQLRRATVEFDVCVKAYGLKCDFLGLPWVSVSHAIAKADDVKMLESWCFCGNRAAFNPRIDKDYNVISNGDLIVIGYNYVRTCYRCSLKEHLRDFFVS